jgi:hypothetical protein
LVTALAYGPVLWAGFVWDDFPLVVDNPQVASLSNIGQWFGSDLWTGLDGEFRSGFYRPLVLMSFAVDQFLWNGNAVGFHLQSLAWHLGAVFLLYRLLSGLFSLEAALLGATLYALHPALSEGVIWIAARNDSMGVALLLGSVLLLQPERPSRRRLLGAGFLFLAALLSKESSIVGLALLLLLDWARWGSPRGRARYGILGLSLGAWFMLRWMAQIESADLELGEGVGLLLQDGDQVLSTYARLLVWPFDLSVGRSLEYLRDPAGLSLLGLLLGGLVFGLLLFRGGRWAVAGLAFATLSMGPALLAIAAKGQLGERYLMMPMVGLVLAFCSLVSPLPRKGLLLLALVYLGFFGIQKRIPNWHSERDLWAAAVQSDPSPYTWGNLGHMHNREGERLRDAGAESKREFVLAMDYFEMSFADPEPYFDNCVILIRAPMRRQEFERGLKNARMGSALGCEQHWAQGASFSGIYGALLALNGNWEEALERLPLALRDPKGRGEVLRAASVLQRWPATDGPSPVPSYCTLRPVRADEAAVFDDSVQRLLHVGGAKASGVFDARGSARAFCAHVQGQI